MDDKNMELKGLVIEQDVNEGEEEEEGQMGKVCQELKPEWGKKERTQNMQGGLETKSVWEKETQHIKNTGGMWHIKVNN